MIEVVKAAKRFGKTAALTGATAHIPRGSIYGLMGPNGSGKTTLLKTIAGIYHPDAGEALAAGEPVWENPAAKRNLFFLPDDLCFLPGSTLESLARLYQGLFPTFDREEYRRLLTIFPLEEKKRLSRFSKGMRRQAGLVLALSCRTPCLLLDEVFDGMDPVVRKKARQLLIREVESRGLTVVIASHNLRELEDLCDRVGLLYQGSLCLERELDSLRESFAKVRAAFPQPVDWDASGLDILRREDQGSLVSLLVRGSPEETMDRLEGLHPLFAEALPLTLEEAFFSEMEVLGYDSDSQLSR
ncbi:MAG: ABC transporter ATP-binding protein [Angelakisella sp.]|jgi:ABC-2 type transport system ATP-binding protein|nr:ABC transporter ATP-binding protein [Angelakisella sp.]